MQKKRRSLILLFSLAHLLDLLTTIYAKEKFHNITEVNPWFKEDVAKKRWLRLVAKKFCIVGLLLFIESFIANAVLTGTKEVKKIYQEYIFMLKISTILGWLVVVSNLAQIVYKHHLSQSHFISNKGGAIQKSGFGH